MGKLKTHPTTATEVFDAAEVPPSASIARQITQVAARTSRRWIDHALEDGDITKAEHARLLKNLDDGTDS